MTKKRIANNGPGSAEAGPAKPHETGGEEGARSAAPFVPNTTNLARLRAAVQKCKGCDLYKNATQAVFGEGPQHAHVMFVGEQPGDQEDIQGKPFVGPAGALLDKALADAGIPRDDVYVTNAVKHFKFTPRGKKRSHQKPNNNEIERCQWWLDLELNLIQPKLIVALGGTAVRALTGTDIKITQMRGQTVSRRGGAPILITVHPSYLLRLPDAAAQREEYARFVGDLSMVAAQVASIRAAA